MNLKGKKVLVVGLARTGIAVVKVLVKHGAVVTANDCKERHELDESFNGIETLDIEIALGTPAHEHLEGKDLVIVSPGIQTSLPFFAIAKENQIEVIGEIELAYRLCKAPIIAITGTNGKTTTTTLVGEIFKHSKRKTFVVGNIGYPFISIVEEAREEDVVILEISSFQLETIDSFRPKIAAILNITPDHLDRHKSFESYCGVKARIFENMECSDVLVYNLNDEETVKTVSLAKLRKCGFSYDYIAGSNAWVENGMMISSVTGEREAVCSTNDLFILGKHNAENALAAMLIAKACGIKNQIIYEVFKTFKGVEHRIELVDTVNGIHFYNDSKGTNPESVMKAVAAMKGTTILIAGGYDKQADYDELMECCRGKVRLFVLLGATAEKIRSAAERHGHNNNIIVQSIQEAVETAAANAQAGENILLSPACASWDMFNNFEERGKLFKEAVFAFKDK